MRLDRLTQNRIMPRQHSFHRLRMLLPKTGAALDVGEKKGNGARRKITLHTRPRLDAWRSRNRHAFPLKIDRIHKVNV